MEFVRNLLLFLHFVGLASLLGGFLVQLKGPDRRVVAAVLHGGITQVVTGVLLVGVLEGMDKDVNHVKIGIKLVIALFVTVMAFVLRKRGSLSNGLFFGLGGLALLNVAIAVFWT
jgi:hypothetical protein